MRTETGTLRQAAIETAEDPQGDLQPLTASNLPYADDTEQIHDELDRAQNEQANQ